MPPSSKRLDLVVVERGLVESREQARRLILTGDILVNGQPSTKPGNNVPCDAQVTLLAPPRFVSRGGEKLEAAFAAFSPDVKGRDCLDVGASTGGFTDCLLQHGASRVAAVDVGRGQLHWRLSKDPRVTVCDGINARYLKPTDIPFTPAFAAVDVAFISLTTVLPAVIQVLRGDAELVTLVKPQFEAGRSQVGRGGVVRDPSVREAVVDRVRAFAVSVLGLRCVGIIESPLLGPAGNVEFLAYWHRQKVKGVS